MTYFTDDHPNPWVAQVRREQAALSERRKANLRQAIDAEIVSRVERESRLRVQDERERRERARRYFAPDDPEA